MWRSILLSLFVGLTAPGCTDDEPSPAPDGGVGGPPDTSVRVKRVFRHYTAGGIEERPEDFTRNPVELFRRDGDTLVAVSGAAGGPGEYVFPDVPQATYYVKLGNTYVVTEARSLDLGVRRVGRADAIDVEQSPTALLDLRELDPWHVYPGGPSFLEDPESSLELVSDELGLVAHISPGLPDGINYVVAHEVPLAVLSGPMKRFEQARGDKARLVQLSPQLFGTLPDGSDQRYLSASRVLNLPPLSYDGTAPLRVEGTLEPLPQRELPLNWRVSAFAALAAEVNPAATLRESRLNLYPAAYGLDEGWIGYSGGVLRLARPFGVSADAVGTLHFGNPTPAHWGLVADVISHFSFRAQDAIGSSIQLTTNMSTRDVASRLTAGPIVPRILPPRALTLDGTEAYSSRALTPGAHVVGWQPPSSGAADAYMVILRRRGGRDDGFPTFLTEATLYVDGSATSLLLPAGLLQAGERYVLTVRAILADGYEVSDRPLMLNDRLPYSDAAALSGLLSVPAP
ncbi:hypothetical protein [Pyxidicoccus xibeiensis]|uniref:hypothetical protein n=1 Tax=Pyxidicoccus xibeiensis TaxID=2906759 RepID=UPI0020A6FBC1|nr:hypothetical protein [Pyxidicoccus xibeiensis]MCP3141566.1 hypothetical protein [Pyxidicoccus xibeiensis]